MSLIEKLLSIIKGLSLLNVAVLGLALALLFPAYIGWKLINNPQLAGLFFSEYREIDSPTDCTLALAQPAGTEAGWYVRAVMAERNRETWFVSVRLRFQPDHDAMATYCAALQAMVDYIHQPDANPVPDFPGSTRPIIWSRLGLGDKP